MKIRKKKSRGRHCCQIFKTKCSNRNICTSLVPLGANWVSKEAENFKELEFFGLVRYFSVKTEKSSKTSKIEPKTWKKRHFWVVFRNLCNFDWKVAHQTKKFEFLEVLRFFWHPVCPQRRETSGDIPIWTFCFENLTTVVPSRIFFVFFKIKSEACFTGLRLKKGYYYTFSVWNHMNLRLLQSTIALFWNDLRGKYPPVCLDKTPKINKHTRHVYLGI